VRSIEYMASAQVPIFISKYNIFMDPQAILFPFYSFRPKVLLLVGGVVVPILLLYHIDQVVRYLDVDTTLLECTDLLPRDLL